MGGHGGTVVGGGACARGDGATPPLSLPGAVYFFPWFWTVCMSVHMCVYVCNYVCVTVRVYECICVCMCISMCVTACMSVHMHVCECVSMSACD